MVNKFKTATKRIAAVAASAAIVSSTAFAGGLSNYPSNFVKDGKFVGQVIVGADAAAIDTTSAQSIIDDLKAEFSGTADKVKITAKKSTGNSDSIKILDSGNVMKFGQDLNDVKGTDFDDKDLDLLRDGTFKNGASDEDYEQFISMANNGFFEHALRDDQENEISTHLWLEDTDVASYKFDMKTGVSYNGDATDWDSDFVGEELEILGNVYTIVSVKSGQSTDTKYGFTELELVGGANKVSLGEGETTTVSIDGVDYEISVQSVADDKVLLSVNGDSKSIDELDTEEVGGVNIAVTDLVSSSRDAVKGYAEIVVGGNKIKLTDNAEIKLNDKDISDLYDNYKATVTFQNSGASNAAAKFEGFTVTYSLDDEVLLNEGDSWNDKVFNAFSIRFDGTNDVEYNKIKVTASSDKLKVEGKLLNGEDFAEDVAMLYDDTAASSTPTVLIGKSDDDRLLVSNFVALDSASQDTASDKTISTAYGLYIDSFTDSDGDDGTINSISVNGQTFSNVASGSTIEVGNFNVKVTEGGTDGAETDVDVDVPSINLKEADGLRFITYDDKDEEQLYEIGSYSVSNEELDVEDLISGDKEEDIDVTANGGNGLADKLDDLTTSTYSSDSITALSTIGSELFFEDEYIISLEDLAASSTTSSAGGAFYVYTDASDLNADDETTADTTLAACSDASGLTNGDFPALTFNTRFDVNDDMFDIELDKTNSKIVLLSGAEADVADNNDNEKEYVDTYGTLIKVDAEDKEWVEISTPDRQVEAQVSLVAGSGAQEVKTYTVDADMVDEKVAELEADGYKVTTEEVTAEPVEFDISAPVFDTDVAEVKDAIVVGGPAVNAAARTLLGIETYTIDQAGVNPGEAVAKYYADSNSVLVYGYSGEDTQAIVEKLNAGTANFE